MALVGQYTLLVYFFIGCLSYYEHISYHRTAWLGTAAQERVFLTAFVQAILHSYMKLQSLPTPTHSPHGGQGSQYETFTPTSFSSSKLAV